LKCASEYAVSEMTEKVRDELADHFRDLASVAVTISGPKVSVERLLSTSV